MDKKSSVESLESYMDRVDALGLMVGGITHDLNNLVGLIMGFGELLEEEEGLSEEGRSFVDKIVSASEKATGLLGFIGRFSRRRKTQRVELSQVQLLAKAVALPEPEIRAQRQRLHIDGDTVSESAMVFVDEILMAGAVSRILLFLSSIPGAENGIKLRGEAIEEEVYYHFSVDGSSFDEKTFSMYLSTDVESLQAQDEACRTGKGPCETMTLTVARAIIEYHGGELNGTDTGYEMMLPRSHKGELVY